MNTNYHTLLLPIFRPVLKAHTGLLFSFFLLYNSTSLSAQSLPELQNETYYGNSWQDDGRALLQNLKGDYVLFGNIRHFLDQRGTDIYFVEMDQQLRKGIERKDIGGRKDDVVNAAVQTFDGSYVLVGYTKEATEKHLGGKDAWLLKMREDGYGDPLLDINLGSKADDEFYAVQQDSEGNLIACGTKGGKFWVVKWDWQGNELWQQIYKTDFSAAAHDLVINRDNSITVTGYETIAKESYRALTVKIDPTGNESWRTVIENARATAITATQSGDYAITGEVIVNKDENLLLAKIGISGGILWQRDYGDYNEDSGNDIVQLTNGNFALTGHTYSYFRRANRSRLWLSIVDSRGEVAVDTAYGGRLNDVGNDLLLTQQNELLLTGASASGKKTEFTDAWVMQFAADTFPTTVRAPILKIENLELIDPDANNRLDPNERAYLAFDLVNKSTATAYGLTATVSSKKVRGVSHYNKLQFGHLRANQRRRLAIPIRAAADLLTGTSRLSMELTSVNGGAANFSDFAIESLKEALPQLSLLDAAFITNTADGRGQLEQPQRLRVTLKNTGQATAEKVRVKFSLPYKVTELSEKLLTFPTVAAGEARTLEFEFQAEEVFLEDSLRVGCWVTETTYNYGTEAEYFLTMTPPQVVTSPPPPITPPTVPMRTLTKAYWIKPQLSQTVSEPTVPVEVLVVAPTAVERQAVQIFLNGERYNQGVKLDVVKYSRTRNQNCTKNIEGKYECYFTAEVVLPEKENQLQMIVAQTEQTTIKTRVLKLTYERQPVALHLLAIGVQYPNQSLRYTDEDAQDIAARYATLRDKAFTEVYQQVLTTTTETTKQNMEDALNELKNRFEYATEEGIDRSQDVVVVFISGHGFIEDRELYLEGSDNYGSNRNARSLMLRNNILRTLKGLPCAQKVVLVDACRKNYRESDKSYELLLGADIPVFFSTGAGKVSYEHDNWQNGAFSEAILQAYANPQAVDRDGNRTISAWELYDYVRSDVPRLVRESIQLKPADDLQVPYLDEVFLDREVAVFSY